MKFSSLTNINIIWFITLKFFRDNQSKLYDITEINKSDIIKSNSIEINDKLIKKDLDDKKNDDGNMNISIRLTKEKKLLRDLLFYSYKKIAFHPETIDILIKRFEKLEQFCNLLEKINTGENLRLKKIYADKNPLGWKEVDTHLSEGKSNRARVYLRSSKIKNCSYELFLDWKQNEKHQEKLFSKIKKLTPFSSREVLYQ